MASAVCQVKVGAGAYGPTTDGVNVAAASAVTINLISSAGVSTWSISCVGTDELLVAGTINAGLTIDGNLKTCAFTAPVVGSALVFKSTVVDVNNVSTSVTFGIYVLATSGYRVGALGEAFEGSAAFGWLTKYNAVMRNPAAVPTPTGTGVPTITAGVYNAAATAITGTGSIVAQTTPTLKTSFILRNPADTFSYTFTPAAIAAARIITLPLLAADDTMVTAAFAQSLTTKTIVAASNTITDTSAALGDILKHDGTRFVRLARGSANQVLTTNAGATDIAWATSAASPGGNANEIQINNGASAFAGALRVLAGTDFISIAATPATTGNLRVPNVSAARFRNAANTQDYGLLETDGTDSLWIGTNKTFTATSQVATTYLWAVSSGNVQIGVGTSGFATLYADATQVLVAQPMLGYAGLSSQWGAVDGISRITVAAANITLTAPQYSRQIQKFTGAPAATRTITYPLPATDDQCYTRLIWSQQTVSSITITNGGGLTVLLAANGTPKRLLFMQEGVVVLA